MVALGLGRRHSAARTAPTKSCSGPRTCSSLRWTRWPMARRAAGETTVAHSLSDVKWAMNERGA